MLERRPQAVRQPVPEGCSCGHDRCDIAGATGRSPQAAVFVVSPTGAAGGSGGFGGTAELGSCLQSINDRPTANDTSSGAGEWAIGRRVYKHCPASIYPNRQKHT